MHFECMQQAGKPFGFGHYEQRPSVSVITAQCTGGTKTCAGDFQPHQVSALLNMSSWCPGRQQRSYLSRREHC